MSHSERRAPAAVGGALPSPYEAPDLYERDDQHLIAWAWRD